MEKIWIFQIEKMDEANIRKIAQNIGILVHKIEPIQCFQTVENIIAKTQENLELPLGKKIPENSMILFENITDKHLEHVLGKLRLANVGADFKAIITETNRKWTLVRLCAEMEREKNEMMKMQ